MVKQIEKKGFWVLKRSVRGKTRVALGDIDGNEKRVLKKPPIAPTKLRSEENRPLIQQTKKSYSIISRYIRVHITFKKACIGILKGGFKEWKDFVSYQSPRCHKTILPRPSSIHDYIDDIASNFKDNTLICYSNRQSSTVCSYSFSEVYSSLPLSLIHI